MAATTQLTIEDFERLPAEQAKNHELVDGELVDVSGNTFEHNDFRDLLICRLTPFQGAGKLVSEQEYDFAGNAHGPDLSYIGPAKRSPIDRKRRVQRFVPDLAIEIVSRNDTFESLLRKKERYRASGVDEVWIVSMEAEEFLVYSIRGNRILKGADKLESELLPGFSVAISELYAGIA